MNLSDFDYDLPEELIAQHPPKRRGDSRLMVVSRERGTIKHYAFDDLVRFITPGDLLVVNDTKVIAARVEARKPTGGRLSILFLSETGDGATCLISGKGIKPGTAFALPGEIEARIMGRENAGEGGEWRIAARFPEGLFDYLEKWGRPPLPPYIKRTGTDDPAADQDRYQTVYAREPGSVAAPTAGLHFTDDMIGRIRARGAEIAAVTLSVGIGTFLPIRTEIVENHRMHAECYEIPPETARAVTDAKERGARVIAVGTTTVRALEGAAVRQTGATDDAVGVFSPGRGETTLFITPGFRFGIIDGLVTNFHLPRSTLLVLVSAFAGPELIREAYRQAVREQYRFFSYGDAMLIL